MNKTKIIATIGPSTNQPHIIRNMIKKGMNVVRLNMAHSSSNKSVENIVNLIREESNKLNQFVAVIMDIAGPKVRVDFSNNKNQNFKIIKNKIYTLGYLKSYDIQINMDINFGSIKDKQAFVKIDDGKIVFKILSTSKKALKIKALQKLKERGIKMVRTDNEENNPMYLINVAVGFKPEPFSFEYIKEV